MLQSNLQYRCIGRGFVVVSGLLKTPKTMTTGKLPSSAKMADLVDQSQMITTCIFEFSRAQPNSHH